MYIQGQMSEDFKQSLIKKELQFHYIPGKIHQGPLNLLATNSENKYEKKKKKRIVPILINNYGT